MNNNFNEGIDRLNNKQVSMHSFPQNGTDPPFVYWDRDRGRGTNQRFHISTLDRKIKLKHGSKSRSRPLTRRETRRSWRLRSVSGDTRKTLHKKLKKF